MKSAISMMALAVVVLSGSAFAEDGSKVFSKNCVTCHGPDGKGETDIGEVLQITNLTDPAVQKRMTDDAIVKQITEGSTDKTTGTVRMPPFKAVLKPEDLKAVLAHVRSLKAK